MFHFNRLPPEVFALSAAFLGIVLNMSLTLEEQNAMGNFIMSIGQTMSTAASQAENQKALSERNDMMKQVDDMSTQLESLKKQLGRGR